jgi:hypothetical protein
MFGHLLYLIDTMDLEAGFLFDLRDRFFWDLSDFGQGSQARSSSIPRRA